VSSSPCPSIFSAALSGLLERRREGAKKAEHVSLCCAYTQLDKEPGQQARQVNQPVAVIEAGSGTYTMIEESDFATPVHFDCLCSGSYIPAA
jgi:hypothetical protein